MTLALVWAMDKHRVIGREGRLPWHLPADLRRFKAITLGHTVIMGRRTFASIGRPLPERRNLVLSRDSAFDAAGVTVCTDLEQALRVAGSDPVFVIGGAEVYRSALPRADRLHVTLVDAAVEGDVRFPDYDESAWRLVAAESHPADARNAHAMRFLEFERIRAAGDP